MPSHKRKPYERKPFHLAFWFTLGFIAISLLLITLELKAQEPIVIYPPDGGPAIVCTESPPGVVTCL